MIWKIAVLIACVVAAGWAVWRMVRVDHLERR
jgi:hypothetical protein